MPIVRISDKLVYYAHVPKCAGSSVEDYLDDRFGRLAFLDRQYLSQPEARRWSRTSPQHVDWAALARLFPADFFADIFTVVRHPVARAISAYRFQSEVERTLTAGTGFGDWLAAEAKTWADNPFPSDNHSRPQSDFLPPADGPPCTVFHLEHGLDALIPYFDMLAGDASGLRAMGHTMPGQRRSAAPGGPPLVPTLDEIALCVEIYAADFDRFGYRPDRKEPLAPAPVLDPAVLAEARAAHARAARPWTSLVHRLRRKAVRMLR